MARSVDVVVVGGGIAGSAVAAQLAAAGLSVLVLERQEEFKDRVRGEAMPPWGVAELRRLGLEDVLVAAGGGFSPTIIGYDEVVDPEEARAFPAPLEIFVDGVPGFFNCGHPQACEALLTHAATSGAEVVRGVGDVGLTPGASPTVRYIADGESADVSCRIVVGADGRQSTVRRAIGIELEQVAAKAMLGGMLVADVDAGDSIILGTSGNVHYLVFPRPNGLARLYLGRSRDDRDATSGGDKAEQFLEPFRRGCFPGSEAFGDATPAGPCAYFPGTDTWTDHPMAMGVVLIGDAAGWSDPILGQGLSIAMRDARSVADVLLGGDEWHPHAFRSYVEERNERMRRLRVATYLDTELRCTFTAEGRARRKAFFDRQFEDPNLFGVLQCALSGPESAPAGTFTDENIQKVLALA